MVAAVAASFSFLQGLALWPVGLICLLWTFSLDAPEARRRIVEASIWVTAALGTTVAALWGYDFKPLGCSVGSQVQAVCDGSVSSFALHHPWSVVEWILVAIGEIIPNTHAGTLWLNGLLGTVLLAAAIGIVIQSIRNRQDGHNCLPTALILFGLLFDFLIAVLRAELLTISWVNSSYEMPNLLILLAIIIYAWDWLARAHVARAFAVIGVALLVLQSVIATRSGIVGSRAFDEHQATAAQLAVNLDAITPQERNCYDLNGVLAYLLFPVVNYVGYAEAREDHLSVFAPDFRHRYREEGLPRLAQCPMESAASGDRDNHEGQKQK